MPIIVRFQCYCCGAPCDAKGEAWTRCDHCRALLGFDYQSWFESADYRRWLAGYAATVDRWPGYQKLVAEAVALAKKGSTEQAIAKELVAQRALLELTPHLFPPEVQTDAAYREQYLRRQAWNNLQLELDPVLARLMDQVTGSCASIDYRDPMKVLRPVVKLIAEVAERLGTLTGGPPDPDSMPPRQRARVWSSQFLSAYLQMITRPQDKLELLRAAYGHDNVKVLGDAAADDDTGMFRDWACPHCGAVTLQHRGVAEYTCLGCMFRLAAGSGREALPAQSLKCPTCGAPVEVPQGAMEGACGFCDIAVHRVAATGDNLRDHRQSLMAQYAGYLPSAGGVVGLPVHPGNRAQMVLAGLMRTANTCARIVAPERYVTTARKAFPSLPDPELARKLEEVEALAAREGGEGLAAEAKELLAAARVLLRRQR